MHLCESELINKFRTLSQGQLSDSVMDKMATTFTELCKIADFQTPTPKKEESKKDDETLSDDKTKEKQPDNLREKIRVDGLGLQHSDRFARVA
jgi:hypothetical protein